MGSNTAKGDHARSQNQLDYQGGMAQNNLNVTRDNINRQNQGFQDKFNNAAGLAGQDYDSMMKNYQGFLNRGPTTTNFNDEYAGYKDFSQTGGFSDRGIQDIRQRAIAPTRSIYSNAQDEVARGRALSGGGANFGPAQAKMAREMSHQISDANINANAGIAQMQQQGKLAGLGGMSGIDQARLQGELANSGLNLGAMQGMNQLYSATPGMAGLYGGMLNNSNQQTLSAQALQNQLGLGLIGAQNDIGHIDGSYKNALGNIGGTMGLIGQGANAASALGGGAGMGASSLPGSTVGLAGSGFGNTAIGTESVGSQSLASNPWWKSILGMGGYGGGSRGFDPNFDPGNPNSTVFNPYFGSMFGGGGGSGYWPSDGVGKKQQAF